MEVADATDHRGSGNDLVAVGGELGDEAGVLCVALDEPVSRMAVVRLDQPAVLAEVVEPDDLMAGLVQLGDQVAVDEPGGAGDQDPHYSRIPPPRAPQTSTTSLPPTSSDRYGLCGAPRIRMSLSGWNWLIISMPAM